MATLEVAALLSPTASTASSAVATGTGAVADGSTATPSFFNRLLQTGAAGDTSADVVTPGLAALNAGRWRALPADPALPAACANPSNPSSSDATDIDLQQAAAALMGTAAPDEAGLGKAGSGKKGVGKDDVDGCASADDAEVAPALDLTVWPGLPLFIEARAALRDGEPASNPPAASTITASTVVMGTTRLQFSLQSTRTLNQTDSEGRIAGQLPGSPSVIETAADTGMASGESIDELSPAAGFGIQIQAAAHHADSVAPLNMRSADLKQSASTPDGIQLPAIQPGQSKPGLLNAPNPVAQLATSVQPARSEMGPLNPVAQLATSVQPARSEAGPLNPVAQLATSVQPARSETGPLNLVAQLATSAQPARSEAGPLNPVAQLATSQTEPTDQTALLEPGSLKLRNPVAQLATSVQPARSEMGSLNPVAQLATSAQPARSEAGPLNSVAQLANVDKSSPAATAAVKTTPVVGVGYTDKTLENIAIARNESTATIRDRAIVNPQAPLSTSDQPLPLHPLIAEPFTHTGSERLPTTQAAPAETAALPEEAPPLNAARSEHPATALNQASVPPLPDVAQARRSPAEAINAATSPRQEPAIPEAATTPRPVETAAPPAAGSPLQAGVSSTAAPLRPDAATPPTVLPTTPDVVDLNQKNWGRTLGQQLSWMVNNQLQQAEIRVNPPDLGPIELRVSLQHNQTSVTFFCHEAAVREALETALPRLREMLGSQGITLNQAQVSDQSLAHQQTGGGGHPAFSQHDDRPPAYSPTREPIATEAELRPRARRLPGAVDDYA